MLLVVVAMEFKQIAKFLYCDVLLIAMEFKQIVEFLYWM